MRSRLNLLIYVLVLSLLLGALGCGSSRNDQGVSFTFLGWFQDSTGTTGQSGLVASLSDPSTETVGTLEAITSFAGLQNHLSDQFVRTTQVFHEYFIPGADVQPPDSVFTFATLLGPVAGNSGNDFNQEGTLPDSFDETSSTSFAEVSVVTTDVRSFINFNRESMPEAPFSMIVTSYAKGVTSSGQSLTSNKTFIEVLFTPGVVIPPTEDTGNTANQDEGEEETSANSEDSEDDGDSTDSENTF